MRTETDFFYDGDDSYRLTSKDFNVTHGELEIHLYAWEIETMYKMVQETKNTEKYQSRWKEETVRFVSKKEVSDGKDSK